MQSASRHVHSHPLRRGRFKLWGFRCGAMLLGLLPFIALELALRSLGLPALPPAADPYVDLHNLRPLFQLNELTDRWEIGPERMNLFRPAGFPNSKPTNAFRVFALGGSTTQGEPYSTETAFPEWLKLNLQAAVGPSRPVEVINCGGLSYASYRVLAILREVLRHSPDLIVIYTGHNEYLEYRSYADYHQPSARLYAWSAILSLRTVQLCSVWAGNVALRPQVAANDTAGKRTALLAEVDALLDYQGGLADYQRGADWFAPIPKHFRWNLSQMAKACRQSDVPLLMMRPVSNLLDCPPFKYEVDPSLSPEQRHRFEEHWTQASTSNVTLQESQRQLHEALAIDPGHAGAHYLLGQHQFASGDFAAAADSLKRAKDLDVCPLRAPTVICDAVTEIADQYRIPLLEADTVFSDRSPHGLVGQRWLVDHIHPNLEGHQLLGELLAELCIEHGFIQVIDKNWKQQRQHFYSQHLDGLNAAYFQRGKQRLEGLLLWTQGRAKKLKSLPPTTP